MNKKAILNLAGLLENIPPEFNKGFNMGAYDCPAGPYLSHVEHTCGSTACIAGWASSALTKFGAIRETPRSYTTLDKTIDNFAANLRPDRRPGQRAVRADELRLRGRRR